MRLPDHVIKRSGPKPGATVAIFCGIHGNERAGILAVDRLAKELKVSAGSVYLVYANPPAIERGVRMVDKNLNRLFVRGKSAGTYEERRAAELMDLLDSCDALLDLHSYPDPIAPERATPFAICEPASHAVAALIDVPIVVSGFTAAQEGGSDGYMHLAGKPGICVELGAYQRPDVFLELGVQTAERFLQRFGCLAGPQAPTPREQLHLTLSEFHRKTHDDFSFAREFRSFDRLRAGEMIAIEGGQAITAESDAYILFPIAEKPVGVETFLLAREAV